MARWKDDPNGYESRLDLDRYAGWVCCEADGFKVWYLQTAGPDGVLEDTLESGSCDTLADGKQQVEMAMRSILARYAEMLNVEPEFDHLTDEQREAIREATADVITSRVMNGEDDYPRMLADDLTITECLSTIGTDDWRDEPDYLQDALDFDPRTGQAWE